MTAFLVVRQLLDLEGAKLRPRRVDPLFEPSDVFDVLSSFGEQLIVASKISHRHSGVILLHHIPDDVLVLSFSTGNRKIARS